jgi:2-keto-3-deoxy-L-rhamnonate aldolase RhmA
MLKQKLASHTFTLGAWITIGHPAIAEIMARAGYEWVVVDLEHTTISLDTAGELIRTIDLCGSAPLVRLTSIDPNQIKRVLDAGAHGIVVPSVNTPEEAARAVAATRYAPQGTRGVGLARAQGYGAGFKKYLEWQKIGPVVIVQIEHKDALGCLYDILTTPGVDGFIVGPYDLSCSLGIPGEFERPEFIEAISRIREIAKKAGRAGGLHIVEPDLDRLDQAVLDGYSFVAYSADLRILDVGARKGIEKYKNIKS